MKKGPRRSQLGGTMRAKITTKYHEQNPPHPRPQDARGRECLPRAMNCPQPKWQRMKSIITTYIKYEIMALANPKLGESMEQTEGRAIKTYRTAKKYNFPFPSNYRILTNEPKWQKYHWLHRGMEWPSKLLCKTD